MNGERILPEWVEPQHRCEQCGKRGRMHYSRVTITRSIHYPDRGLVQRVRMYRCACGHAWHTFTKLVQLSS